MIEIKNICAGYGKEDVLKNISLNLPKGTLISVVGVNGSGKSTLLKTVTGILPATSGEVLIDGLSTENLSRREIAQRVAYLPQGKSVPDMTVGQMVLHGRFAHLRYPRRYGENDCKLAREAMKKMNIESFAECTLPTLSGGMRQKAYIAMALAQDTDYILLDEPTAFLDISAQLELMRNLRNLADSGKGIIAVMHDLPIAFSFSDMIVAVREGEALITGAPAELCEKGIIKEIFGVDMSYDGAYHYKY